MIESAKSLIMGPLHIIDKPNNIQEDTHPDILNAMHTMKSDD